MDLVGEGGKVEETWKIGGEMDLVGEGYMESWRSRHGKSEEKLI